MSMRWERPRVKVQNFIANEYVSVCWSASCSNNTTYYNRTSNAPYGNRWSGTEGPYDRPFAHGGSCREPSKNFFRGNADGSGLTFVEENSADQGTIPGGFDYWFDANGNGIVDGNGQTGSDVIYWYTTRTDGSQRWNHWGYVQSADSSHPNRS